MEIRVTVAEAAAAQHLAQRLVQRRLAACVQVLGPITSVYSWEGKVHSATEWLLLIKTTAEAFPALSQAVVEEHSYEVPEITAVPIEHALATYAQWVRELVRAPGGTEAGAR